MNIMLAQLKDLVALTGPSGMEDDVVEYIVTELALNGIKAQVDPLGNIIAIREGTGGPTVMISVHADEIGFIVKKIEHNGYIRFEKLGGGDNRILLAQRVWVRGENGQVLGVIGCKSAHLSNVEERNKVVPHQDLYIDVGAASDTEVRAAGIEVGDPVTFASELHALGASKGQRLIGKAFDDRLGCVILLRLFRELGSEQLPATINGIFSVQEEVGLRGAKTASYPLTADVALAVDATAAGDTPDGQGAGLILGKGPGIKVMDSSMIAHRAVTRRLASVAKEKGIPYQLEILPGIGTDAGALHLHKGGVPTGVISIPNRYTHSPIEMVDVEDLEQAYQLLKHFVLSLKPGDSFAFGRKHQ